MCVRMVRHELSPSNPEIIEQDKEAAAEGTPEEVEAGKPRHPVPSSYKFCHKYSRNKWRAEWCMGFGDHLRTLLGTFAGYGENMITNKNIKQILYDIFERHFWFKRYGLKGQGLDNNGKMFSVDTIAKDVCRKVTSCPSPMSVTVPLSMKNQNPDSWFALQNSDKVRQEIEAKGWETGFGPKAIPATMNTTQALARGLKKLFQMPKLVLDPETGTKNFDNEAPDTQRLDDFLEVSDVEGGEDKDEDHAEKKDDEEEEDDEDDEDDEQESFLEANAHTRSHKRVRAGKGPAGGDASGMGGVIKALPKGKCGDRESWEVEVLLQRRRQTAVDRKKRCYSCYIRQYQYQQAAAELENLWLRPDIVELMNDDPFPETNDTDYTKLMKTELEKFVNDTTACPVGLYPGFDKVMMYKWKRMDPILNNKYKRIAKAPKKALKKKKKGTCLDLKVKYKASLREPVVTQEECIMSLRNIEMDITKKAYEYSQALNLKLRLDEPYEAKYRKYMEMKFVALRLDGEIVTRDVNNAAILAGTNSGGKTMCQDVMLCSVEDELSFGFYWDSFRLLESKLPFEDESNLDEDKVSVFLERGGIIANPPGWSRRTPGVDVLAPKSLEEIYGGESTSGTTGDNIGGGGGNKAGGSSDAIKQGLQFKGKGTLKVAQEGSSSSSSSDIKAVRDLTAAHAHALLTNRRASAKTSLLTPSAQRIAGALKAAEGKLGEPSKVLASDLEADGWALPNTKLTAN